MEPLDSGVIGPRKRIALVAHDNKKRDLSEYERLSPSYEPYVRRYEK